MSVAFVATSPYQLHHYKHITPHLRDVTIILEVRDQEFALTEQLINQHIPDTTIDIVPREKLKDLDGRFDAIVCHTPILPLEFLDKTLVVAQQYSLAKENYQYGLWRAQADLNLMYGPYSQHKIEGFSRATATGNPLLDDHFTQPTPTRHSFNDPHTRKRLLYLPTYGELSSLHHVMPVLEHLDADITVKLHHAHTDTPHPTGDHITIRHSDTDPVALLREHDGVISDHSGAAYDAHYAGLPVVLAITNPTGADLERLSTTERHQSPLTPVTAAWHPDTGPTELLEAFNHAEKLTTTPEHQHSIDRLFTNPGTAGAACAHHITQLIHNGPTEHFAADQVRTTVRRYITTNRRLKTATPPKHHPATPTSSRQRVKQRLTHLVAKNPTTLRLARAVRRKIRDNRTNTTIDPTRALAAAPATRREAILHLLQPHLANTDVALARDDQHPGADLATTTNHKRPLHHALTTAATHHPDLVVRIGSQWKVFDVRPLAKLTFHDLTHADWIEIGTTAEHSRLAIGTTGYLKILFVEHDRERNRYLARKRIAHRVDWTPLLTNPTTTGPIRAVGQALSHPCEPIDVVYTWVDSSDPDWQHDLHTHRTDTFNDSATNTERFIDRQELRYSLRALNLFAPFVNHIYIVTAGQHPTWLTPDHPRITVIPHTAIFPDPHDLPTFNSHAIEACLHRIPGLAENFLYFNDDVFLGREATPDDFYTLAGQAKVRLSPSQYIYQGRPETGAIPTDWAAYNSLSLLSQHFPLTLDRRVKHVPLVQKRSVLTEIEQRFPTHISQTRAARFRSATDLAIPSMFAQYYGMATGRAVEWPGRPGEYQYLDTGRDDSLDRFQTILHNPPNFFCLNATRHTQIDLPTQAKNLTTFFNAAFPDPADWETATTKDTP